MTINDKKRYLRQYRGLRKEESQLLDEIRQIKASALPRSGGTAGSGSGTTERDLSDWAARWDMAERRLAEIRAEAADRLLQIEEELRKIPEAKERVLLRGHYIQGKSLEKLGREMNYSTRHMWTLHRTALQNFNPERVPKDGRP